jgi:hypothetical protein
MGLVHLAFNIIQGSKFSAVGREWHILLCASTVGYELAAWIGVYLCIQPCESKRPPPLDKGARASWAFRCCACLSFAERAGTLSRFGSCLGLKAGWYSDIDQCIQ